MEFREINYEEDLDSIIQLLNANFPTTHTKEAFIWKHYENPFGKSYGLLAVDKDRIVGLRMFMRWEFICDNQVIKAIRPVDTCTDHDYRGQGLFKKLTLEGLDNVKAENELIFNTPNSNSKPGYLKMGWKEIENTFEYRIGMLNFFKNAVNFETITSEEIEFKQSWLMNNQCQTNISNHYLKWRYRNSDYKIARSETGAIIVYRFTSLKKINTIILIDSFGDKLEVNKLLNSVGSRNSIKIIYFLNNNKSKAFKFLFTYSRGNQVVVSKDDVCDISQKINFSIGDLEGKL
ncbi:acetyltransferase (GNAT) family protein [Gramella sp. Hel_I_59]|uniref:GNAT family N-acetyltransferase n=1 Tax=Gramella sp. Hel_I_59 TaxID=1249978 RepID=UPI001154E58A|nr:GNAT family N-acetyltransferase [Gramella sp. Hel_I_59]TQI70424.1 acetyltransferase (GNAT) family protein [Gramella sp. Hel_I_59]